MQQKFNQIKTSTLQKENPAISSTNFFGNYVVFVGWLLSKCALNSIYQIYFLEVRFLNLAEL